MTEEKNILQKTISLATALLTGENVSQERMLKRLEICASCDMVQKNNKTMRCGICGCKLKGDKSLVNLVRYEETARYGCKHNGGSRWKKAGV